MSENETRLVYSLQNELEKLRKQVADQESRIRSLECSLFLLKTNLCLLGLRLDRSLLTIVFLIIFSIFFFF